ncbi:Hypothetical_protein [Hexamita inflata]|uniref:Hypothetical_protein n=1 Tax=Hexamita inflata TaxID=28002 RepID=A0AA86NU65_9EUKA|nr:Hypothetical protein HINF_LOCUS14262 [Hexamita inflata]
MQQENISAEHFLSEFIAFISDIVHINVQTLQSDRDLFKISVKSIVPFPYKELALICNMSKWRCVICCRNALSEQLAPCDVLIIKNEINSATAARIRIDRSFKAKLMHLMSREYSIGDFNKCFDYQKFLLLKRVRTESDL